jgi:hypothetical protein
MTPARMIGLTLYAAFSGLIVVGMIRFQSFSLLVYGGTLIYFVANYRRLKGTDEKSVAFQNEMAERTKDMPFGFPKKDFGKIEIMGICACLFLIAITVLNSYRHAK